MKKRGGAYRGTLKARINKLYGGDVTCSKVKSLKGRKNKSSIIKIYVKLIIVSDGTKRWRH